MKEFLIFLGGFFLGFFTSISLILSSKEDDENEKL